RQGQYPETLPWPSADDVVDEPLLPGRLQGILNELLGKGLAVLSFRKFISVFDSNPTTQTKSNSTAHPKWPPKYSLIYLSRTSASPWTSLRNSASAFIRNLQTKRPLAWS